MALWRRDQIRCDLDPDGTYHPIATLAVETPAYRSDIDEVGRCPISRGCRRGSSNRGEPPVSDSSPAVPRIEWPGRPQPILSVSATRSLHRRHVDLLHARRSVAHMMAHGKAVIQVPKRECFGRERHRHDDPAGVENALWGRHASAKA